ncbi:MAG: hypothetical protein KJ941_00810 [Bacteroidetes bacterium]|nr:hypothetical protein [Bacteroidota bacterium]
MKVTKSIFMTALIAVSMSATSCKKEGCTDEEAINYSEKAKKDDGSCEYASTSNSNTVSGNISSNTTWSADKIWILNGKVVVTSGATLTIEPGTIIKGAEGSSTLASALVIAKGAKIIANGTAAKPIIFTSVLDNIEIGQTVGTSLAENAKGKWGGLIILGNANISAANGDFISQIEGIPASESYGSYGGNDNLDNSGVLNYVSIRHGGALIGAGNEINGLTLGGVGSGTTITNIEIVGNLDDGVELFGGTVNITNILVAYVGDDGIDIDQNYAGTIDNFIVIQDVESDKGLEIDGTEGTTHKDGLFTLSNGSVYSKDGAQRPADFKDKAQGTIENLKIYGFTNGKIKVRASYQNECADVKTDACSNLIAASPKLIFNNCEINDGVELYTGSTNSSQVACPVQASDVNDASAKVVSVTAVGGSTSSFAWSWTAMRDKF